MVVPERQSTQGGLPPDSRRQADSALAANRTVFSSLRVPESPMIGKLELRPGRRNALAAATAETAGGAPATA
jgi:hypothetical protein